MSKLRRIGSGRGRRKGERRPGDLSREHQRRCEVALQDVPRIRQAWQHRFGKTNRREEPTALQIAAHAHGLDESDLIAFRKRSR